MRIEPRETVSWFRVVLAPVLAVLAALAICSVLILWAGVSVPSAYLLLLKGAFGPG